MRHDHAPRLRAVASRAFAPRECLTPEAFAKKHINLPEMYAQPGPLDFTRSRYMLEPLRACFSPYVRRTSMLKAIQTGGTLVTEATIVHAIVNAPGPIMWTFQTEDAAKEHGKGRFMPMLLGCPAVKPLLPVGPKARHDQNDTSVYFGSFYLVLNEATSVSSLQSKSIKWKINSELWLWKQGMLAQANGRTGAFEVAGTSKIINESQGGLAGSDWEQEFLRGTQRRWQVRCFSCGHYSDLAFFGRMHADREKRACVVWDKSAVAESGEFDEQRVRDSARWVCPSCGHAHEDTARTRARWDQEGRYSDKRPGSSEDNESYQWNSLVCHSIGALAVKWLYACAEKKRGLIESMKNFYMQQLAEFWRPEEAQSLTLATLTLSDYSLTDEDLKKRLKDEAARFMTVDRQRDHFWAVIRAWRTDGSSRLLWRGRLVSKEAIQHTADLYEVEARNVFQDQGYEAGHVYNDCANHGWNALQGEGDDGFTWEVKDAQGKPRKERRLYSRVREVRAPNGKPCASMMWASDPVKDILARLRNGTGARWELPRDVDAGLEGAFTYSRQMAGEVKKKRVNKTTGFDEERWCKVGENHFWDCEAMQIAVAMAMRLLAS